MTERYPAHANFIPRLNVYFSPAQQRKIPSNTTSVCRFYSFYCARLLPLFARTGVVHVNQDLQTDPLRRVVALLCDRLGDADFFGFDGRAEKRS